MSETRMITVKGEPSIFKVTADSAASGAKTTRRRPKLVGGTSLPTVFTKIGGTGSATSAAVAGAGNAVAAPTTTTTTTTTTAQATAPATATATAPAAAAAAAQTQTQTGAGRVVLGNKKAKQMKVVLTKKNHGPAASAAASETPANPKKHRKVTLGIQHLKRRVTKARRLNKITKGLSIDQIKKELIAAKIIKEESKAPEPILRQMYADAKLITTKSL